MTLTDYCSSIFQVNSTNLTNEQRQIIADLVFKEYYKKIFNYFYLNTKSREISQELAQDSMIHLVYNIEKYDSEKSKLNTWIWIVIRRRLIDHVRKYENQIITKEFDENIDELYLTDDGLNEELDILIKKESQNMLIAAIDKLSSKNKETILLWIESELSMDEMAQILNTSLQNIKNRLFQSKNQLKKILSQDMI